MEMRKRQQDCQVIQFLPLFNMLLMDIGSPAKRQEIDYVVCSHRAKDVGRVALLQDKS